METPSAEGLGEDLCAEFWRCKNKILDNCEQIARIPGGYIMRIGLNEDIGRARKLVGEEKRVCAEYESVLLRLLGDKQFAGILTHP